MTPELGLDDVRTISDRMLNEVEKYTGWGNEDQPARYQSLLESKTGKTWYLLFAQEFGDWSSNGKGHVILSKYPFAATDRVAISYDRVIADARIVVNGRTISLLVTHLDPDSSTRRLTQASRRWPGAPISSRPETGRSLPSWAASIPRARSSSARRLRLLIISTISS